MRMFTGRTPKGASTRASWGGVIGLPCRHSGQGRSSMPARAAVMAVDGNCRGLPSGKRVARNRSRTSASSSAPASLLPPSASRLPNRSSSAARARTGQVPPASSAMDSKRHGYVPLAVAHRLRDGRVQRQAAGRGRQPHRASFTRQVRQRRPRAGRTAASSRRPRAPLALQHHGHRPVLQGAPAARRCWPEPGAQRCAKHTGWCSPCTSTSWITSPLALKAAVQHASQLLVRA